MRRLIVVLVAAMLVSITSCNKFKDIKINDANVTKISPYGLRGLDVRLAVEIDNPAPLVNLSDMEADVKYCGKVLGKVTLDPFTMKARSVETYDLKAKMQLDEKVTLYDMLMVLDKNFTENCVLDITVKGKLRGGISKTITQNDVPLKKLIKYGKKKK